MVFFIHLQSLLCKWACVIHLLSKWPSWKITHVALYFLPKIHKFYTQFVKIYIKSNYFGYILDTFDPKWPKFYQSGPHFVKVAPKSWKNKWPLQISTC